jgi:hypothetical protein
MSSQTAAEAFRVGAPLRAGRAARVGAVAVVAVLAIVGFGGYAVDASLSDETGAPLTVGGVVRILPLSGWRVASSATSRSGSVLLTRGGGNLRVVTARFGGGADQLLAAYVKEVLQPGSSRLATSKTTQTVKLDSGMTGLRLSYLRSDGNGEALVEGQLTAVVSASGSGAVFDAFAFAGLFSYELGDVDHMIATARVS